MNWGSLRRLTTGALLLSLAVCLPGTFGVEACGPDPPMAVFTATRHPDNPQTDFVAGKMGVILPSWYQRYLIFSFRQLAALPVDSLARRAVLGPRPSRSSPSWVEQWLSARAAVPEAEPIERIVTGRPIDPEEPYVFYQNINDDAFRNAVETLRSRVERFSETSPSVRLWLEGQDSVFANHHPGISLPPDPSADTPPLIRADRQYQTAAAYFYAGRFEEAAARFESVAQNSASPWKTLAPYLAARAWVRRGTVTPGYGDLDTLALERAESRLESILADEAQTAIHEPARQLLSFVRLRTKPERQVLELCLGLTPARLDSQAAAHIRDLTWLFDRVDRVRVRELARENPEAAMADWVLTFQARGDASRRHAVDRWRSSRSLSWLVCAIAKTEPGDDHIEDILTAASALRPSSSAYPTLSFHRARLLSQIDSVRARALLDSLLADPGRWPRSTQNLFLSLRFRLTSGEGGFWSYAPRQPVGMASYATGTLSYQDEEVLLEDRAFPGSNCLDVDAAVVLNYALPLSRWSELAQDERLPRNIRAEIALAGWARAELWEQAPQADDLAGKVQSLVPALSGDMESYLAAADRSAKRFTAVWTFLRYPGIRPFVRVGLGRLTPLGERDVLRDNWWCATHEKRYEDILRKVPLLSASRPYPLPPDSASIYRMVSGPDRMAVIEERSPLEVAPNVLGRAVLEWAEHQPEDPRLPEALHLAVQATRYGCTDSLTTGVSKACFGALHRRYPGSTWAARTKYWY